MQALNDNQDLGAAFVNNQDCLVSTTCSGDCQLVEDTCVFPALNELSQWVTGTNTYCNFIKQVVTCLQATADACPAECSTTPSGEFRSSVCGTILALTCYHSAMELKLSRDRHIQDL